MKGGRPSIFNSPEEMETQVNKYLDNCKGQNELPTVAGFSVFLDSYEDIIAEYARSRPEFSTAIKRLKQYCKEGLIRKGLKNEINSTMAMFLLKANYGLIERQYVQNENVNIETTIKMNDKDIDRIKGEIQQLRDEKFGEGK